MVITFSLNNLVYIAVFYFIFKDKLLKLIESNEKKLAKKIADLILPVSRKYLDVPQVLDAGNIIFYPTEVF